MKLSRRFGLSLLLLVVVCTSLAAKTGLDEMDRLPPGEQYRQLSLILLISGGTDPGLLNALKPVEDRVNQRGGTQLTPDDYKTPLIRIVDQESMLAGAVFLLRFAGQSRDEIEARLAGINRDNPILISMVDMNSITEDAIIIRNAIADAVGFSDLVDNEGIAELLLAYRTQTLRLRNIMEFELYEQELDRLTEEAIASVGGKLDAYQRMFDEEVDTKGLDRQFDAAQYIFNRSEKFDEKAGIMTEEIMKNVILSQSKPVP